MLIKSPSSIILSGLECCDLSIKPKPIRPCLSSVIVLVIRGACFSRNRSKCVLMSAPTNQLIYVIDSTQLMILCPA